MTLSNVCGVCLHDRSQHYRSGPNKGACREIIKHRYVVVFGWPDGRIRDGGDVCTCLLFEKQGQP